MTLVSSTPDMDRVVGFAREYVTADLETERAGGRLDHDDDNRCANRPAFFAVQVVVHSPDSVRCLGSWWVGSVR